MTTKACRKSGNKRSQNYLNICKICGGEFLSAMPFSIYCSRKCKRRGNYLQSYVHHPHLKNLIPCKYCGNLVHRSPASIKHCKSGNFYCNKSCKAKAQFKKQQIKCFCYNCGKEMFRSPSGVIKNGKLSENIFCLEWHFGQRGIRFSFLSSPPNLQGTM